MLLCHTHRTNRALRGPHRISSHRFWASEFCWSRAIELEDSAKLRSNRAHVRVLLGRRARFQGTGYSQSARELLEEAVADATAAVAMDPKWERAHQRLAEAYLALGPYEKALECCRALARAFKECAQPSAILVKLQGRAKSFARAWAAVKPGAEPKEAIEAALDAAVSVLVQNLFVSSDSTHAAAFGTAMAIAIHTVLAVLSMPYLHRKRWGEGSMENFDFTNAQVRLRLLARCIPLSAVEHSIELKQLVFFESPWSMWGWDRLDRAGVFELPSEANDPCDADDVNSAFDAVFKEGVARQPDGSDTGMSMSLDMLKLVKETISGKAPDSPERDMAPHHVCGAFCVSILERLLVSDRSPLAEAAMDRVLGWQQTNLGNWAGGEFLAFAVKRAAGLPGSGCRADKQRQARFLMRPGAVAALAVELTQADSERTGDDSHKPIKDALSGISPAEWAVKAPKDIAQLLAQYVVPAMDGALISLNPGTFEASVAVTLGNLLEGFPDIVAFLEHGEDCGPQRKFLEMQRKRATGWEPTDQDIAAVIKMKQSQEAFTTLLKGNSGFAAYFVRRFGIEKSKALKRGEPCSTQDVRFDPPPPALPLVPTHRTRQSCGSHISFSLYASVVSQTTASLVRKWIKVPAQEKAGYRWASYGQSDREELEKAGMAPVDRTERDRSDRPHAVLLPVCANCRKETQPGVKLLKCGNCKAVSYCSAACQRAAWPGHKSVCPTLSR